MKRMKLILPVFAASFGIMITGCSQRTEAAPKTAVEITTSDGGGYLNTADIPGLEQFTLTDVPEWDGYTPFVVMNDGNPYFTVPDTIQSFETYSDLDSLGRCGTAYALVEPSTMPTKKRESIGNVKPTGWQTPQIRYDFIDNTYLYNRCHLIGFQLCGENANEKNLITGTRWLNIQGMLDYENQIADYVTNTGKRVLYRVTPVFVGDELTCRGLIMEAKSVDDNGLHFCVYAYNEQPGITIDHATGKAAATGDIPQYGRGLTEKEQQDTHQASAQTAAETSAEIPAGTTYILNTNSRKFHRPECESAAKMSKKNREESNLSRDELISQGYEPCGACKP